MTPDPDPAVALARTLPPDAVVSLRAAALLALADRTAPADGVPRLLTVDDLSRRYSVATSTARGWLTAGRCPGAVKLSGLGWRVPPDALPALEAHLRTDPDVTDLSCWRRTRRPAA